jgi:hypothetical protein
VLPELDSERKPDVAQSGNGNNTTHLRASVPVESTSVMEASVLSCAGGRVDQESRREARVGSSYIFLVCLGREIVYLYCEVVLFCIAKCNNM